MRLALAALLLVASGFTAHAAARQTPVGGRLMGDAAAPLEVLEFLDFGCGACALFVRESWPELEASHVATGRVRWRKIPFALPVARNSELGARAAECAARQHAFDAMHDVLFSRQRDWATARRGDAVLSGYAAELELDVSAFQSCLDDREVRATIRANGELARRLGVRGTPTFLVGARRIQGAVPADLFREVLDELLEPAGH